MARALLLGAAILLAGCAVPGSPQTASTSQPAGPVTAAPDIALPADAEFRSHLGNATGQLGTDVKLWAGDLLAGDSQSAQTDARFFLGDFDAELAWLAQHPAASCYSSAWTGWRKIVTAERGILASYLKGTPVARIEKQMTALGAQLASYAFNTSC